MNVQAYLLAQHIHGPRFTNPNKKVFHMSNAFTKKQIRKAQAQMYYWRLKLMNSKREKTDDQVNTCVHICLIKICNKAVT